MKNETGPDGFSEWSQDKRNAYAAAEYQQYLAKQKANAGDVFEQPTKPKFTLIPHSEIFVPAGENWLVDRMIPTKGIGVIFGASGAFKSFIASDLALHLAAGLGWAGREGMGTCAVYIAAEGAAGLHKRKVGWEVQNGNLPASAQFWLIEAAPNLGAAEGDALALIASIESRGVTPGLIIIDTLAQSLGGADENGGGMIAFVGNLQRLSAHFGCFVLAVHHIGHSAEGRMRGHSSLHAGVDVALLCERRDGLSASLSLAKAKDEAGDLAFAVNLSRIVVGTDNKDREISTLVVSEIVETAARAGGKGKTVAPQKRLLMDCIAVATGEAGESIRPFGNDGPMVTAVHDESVRAEYYRRIVEQATPGEEPEKLAERQRKAFHRNLNALLDCKTLVATSRAGRRLVWLS